MDPTTQARRERVLTALADPGFTPGRRDLPILLEQLTHEAKARRARVIERAILRMGPPVEDALLRALARDDAPVRLRQRLVRALARLPEAEERPTVRAALTRRLDDPAVIVRRAAALALGKLAAPASAEARAVLQLARRASADERTRPELVRACVEALGKCGDDDALAWMATLDARAASDPELARLREQASLRIRRTSRRADGPTRLDDRRAPPEPVELIARCRPGLSDILKEELESRFGEARALDSSRVLTRLRGPLRAIWGARSMLSFGFPLPTDGAATTGAPETIQDTALAALGAPRTRALVETWTEGQAKFRVAWTRGGSRRAETWALAAAVSRALPWFPNDPTQSPWELVIDDARGPADARFELRPRGLEDPRFAYRVGDVPAASHPTIAAALARVSGASPDDIVWDPFAGSGLELIERGLLAPYRRLIGSDLDDDALTVARRNLEAADLTKFELRRADARRYQPGRGQVTSIITNPPMGRRVARGDIGPLLDDFLVHAAGLLAPNGRLTWLSPLPKRTRRVCEAQGLALERASQVDMGGFTVELQRWRKRRGHR